MLAQEIAFDPHVRQSLRSTYHERAVISTKPTAKGTKEITMEHMYRVSHRLEEFIIVKSLIRIIPSRASNGWIKNPQLNSETHNF